jgi:DNA (cytosine-5)-methyltransferase 1
MNDFSQISLFDGTQKFLIKKQVRLISMFSGYDSQELALKYCGIKYEPWKTCEWAVKSIQALKDMHYYNDDTDYSKDLSHYQIVQYLLSKGISSNYNEPMKEKQIIHLGEKKARQIYNNIKATNNLVNIQQVKGTDLEIVETDKYDYILTYSFPCQDLSMAGKRQGMAKGDSTRSGMLWEVERILDECLEGGALPQILLMENVPEVIGTNNIKHFAKWLEKLESIGYKCYWKILNAKDYGVPQNRERCFMISILGDYYYDFPKEIKLEHKLKFFLEHNVDEKFYLSDKMKEYCLGTNQKQSKFPRGERFCQSLNMTNNNGIATTITTASGQRPTDNFILEDGVDLVDYSKSENFLKGKSRIMENKQISPTILTKDKFGVLEKNLKQQLCNDLIKSGKVKDGDFVRHSYSSSRMKNFRTSNRENPNCSPTLDTRCDCLGVVQDLRIRKLTPKECFRLMGVKDADFEKVSKNQSNASLYHLAGDSIVVEVLCAIFGQMIEGFNFHKVIEDFYKETRGNGLNGNQEE